MNAFIIIGSLLIAFWFYMEVAHPTPAPEDDDDGYPCEGE